jgi:uncharacterized protein
MAVNPKTPGVYIEEIPVFPASIAGVATAVPAFMGYVEKAENNGVGIPFHTPTRITSLLEYETIFGKAEGQDFNIDIDDNTLVTPTVRTVTVTKNPTESLFKLYYNLQMYFSNGGGPCYIVPVGLYSGGAVNKTDLLAGLDAISKVDEPTLLVFPDAISLSTIGANKDVYDAALAQCEKLKDRFTIMDVRTTAADPNLDSIAFRNNGIGPDSLKYGASYYPFLNTTLGFQLNLDLLHITSQKVNGVNFNTKAPSTIGILNLVEKALQRAQQGLSAAQIQFTTLSNTDITTYRGYIVAAVGAVTTALTSPTPIPEASVISAISPLIGAIEVFVKITATTGPFFDAVTNYNTTPTRANADALIVKYNQLISDLLALRTAAYAASLPGYVIGSLTNIKNTNPSLYNTIAAKLASYSVQLNPSGAMAGIYARVDSERGVWKAPANVGVRGITGPSINVTNSEQDGLNVDATSGKSINVIRAFTGRGTLVWGARTLAGNDNEWRYINVRRLFTYVEESVQEATAFVVFESNTANTWQRVKGMIEAFLTGIWRDGALAGATTKDAYFVRVGLGVTMTAQDILEGRMIVEIGMAAVRPAEFIILKFEHKLQES